MNRHTIIAVTTMMLVAEAYGLDTAPMEGFDPAAVKRELDFNLNRSGLDVLHQPHTLYLLGRV